MKSYLSLVGFLLCKGYVFYDSESSEATERAGIKQFLEDGPPDVSG